MSICITHHIKQNVAFVFHNPNHPIRIQAIRNSTLKPHPLFIIYCSLLYCYLHLGSSVGKETAWDFWVWVHWPFSSKCSGALHLSVLCLGCRQCWCSDCSHSFLVRTFSFNKELVSEEQQTSPMSLPSLILKDKLSLVLCVICVIDLKYSKLLKFTEKRAIEIYWFMFHEKKINWNLKQLNV